MKSCDRLKGDIRYEKAQIETVVSDIKRLRLELQSDEPSRDQKTAMAGYLMNFYNGLENIMKRVAKEYYATMPTGELWHKQLLKQSLVPPTGMEPLFSERVVNKLYGYLGFRHFFIHGYGFKLSWEKTEVLVVDIDALWHEVEGDLDSFIAKVCSSDT